MGNLKLGLFGQPGEKCNGYAVGKHWMDAQVKMWHHGIKEGVLFAHELYDDGRFPHWWLDRVLPKDVVERHKDFDEFRQRFRVHAQKYILENPEDTPFTERWGDV